MRSSGEPGGVDDHAANAAVAHQQVAAEPEPEQRRACGQHLEEFEQIGAIARLKNTSAGPPTCQEVWRDIGSSRFTRGSKRGSMRSGGAITHASSKLMRHAAGTSRLPPGRGGP